MKDVWALLEWSLMEFETVIAESLNLKMEEQQKSVITAETWVPTSNTVSILGSACQTRLLSDISQTF